MDKKIIKENIGISFEFNARTWENNYSDIDTVISLLEKSKENGATHISWIASCDWDKESDTCNVQPFFFKSESDEDYTKRINILLNEQKMEDEKELELYEKLKKKLNK